MTRRMLGTAALALGCLSCGNAHRLYPVCGKVTYHGQPATGAIVHFRRTPGDPMNDPAVMGVVAADGSFSVVSGDLGQGATPGEYAVFIEWRQDRDRRRTGANTVGPHDRLGGRYTDPVHPRFHAVVEAQNNRLDPFELTD